MAFGTKKSVVAAPSFSERMASIKSMFKTAHENASNLHAEMEQEIKNKEAQIASLQSEIETISTTKKDKKDGTLGIRSIWENIHSGQVFTVCFKKQDKPKSKRKLQEEIDAIVEQFSNSIDTVKNNKKGVANAAKNLITELVNNPVLPYEDGEDRVLRGYKIQFESRDGRYDCVDMDITKTDKESGIRPVNILTIKWLIFNGVKYIVE